MALENLIDLIDRYTNDGANYPNESQKEEVGFEDRGAVLVQNFSSRDWFALRSLNLKARSSLWVECLIDILDRAYIEEAKQIIIHIALTGTEENFLKAMEHIRKFRRYVSTYEWLKLENRSTQISSNKYNN